jgi:hypothetical protein
MREIRKRISRDQSFPSPDPRYGGDKAKNEAAKVRAEIAERDILSTSELFPLLL